METAIKSGLNSCIFFINSLFISVFSAFPQYFSTSTFCTIFNFSRALWSVNLFSTKNVTSNKPTSCPDCFYTPAIILMAAGVIGYDSLFGYTKSILLINIFLLNFISLLIYLVLLLLNSPNI